MGDATRVKDKSSLHRYRTELPNLIVDADLSVYAFRLYVHLKRRAGDDGSCWEGTRALATACHMSMGQVSKAKQELLDKNLIRKTTRKTRGGQVDEITIVDLWPENFKTYAKDESVHTVNTSEEPFTTRTVSSESVHHTNTSDESVHTVNVKRSPGEQEEELLKKNGRSPTSSSAAMAEHVKYLIDQGMGAANQFASLDPSTAIADFNARRADGQSIAQIVLAWRTSPPQPGGIYAAHQSNRPRTSHPNAPSKHGYAIERPDNREPDDTS